MSATDNVEMPSGRSRRSLFGASSTGMAAAASIGVAAVMASESARAATISDADIFNFALNFEYLGAEYYLRAVTGQGIAAISPSLVTGAPNGGGTGTTTAAGTIYAPANTLVPFSDSAVAYFAEQLANDELAHVKTVRAVLGNASVAEPSISFDFYSQIARDAGLVGPTEFFNPFESEINFLLGAYLLEDVCVTALCGAAALVTDKVNLAYAAGFLGVEAQQAGAIRGFLSQFGAGAATNAISALRASLSTVGDQGTADEGNPFNISNGDSQAQAFRRTPAQVLAIAYAGAGLPGGGIFPNGVSYSNAALASS
jgi:hypothetical protein